MTTTIIEHGLQLDALEPISGTLLDVAKVTDDAGYAAIEGSYDSYACLDISAESAMCPDPRGTVDPDSSPQWVDAFRFAVWGGVVCKMMPDDAEDRIREIWDLREHIGIERAFMQTRFVASAGTPFQTGTWDAPTDLTPGSGAVDPKVGIALLESHAAANYAGKPIFHMPRVIASLLSFGGVLSLDGKMLRTTLGSRVAAGGGYDHDNSGPTGAVAPAGEKWIYGTGRVTIAKSGLVIPDRVIDMETNDMKVVAQRFYVGTVDCYTAAVRVKVQ